MPPKMGDCAKARSRTIGSEGKGGMSVTPQRGDFVRVRSRRWLVEDERSIEGLAALRLACVDDDAQGETVDVLWDAELDAEQLGDEGWASVAKLGTDDPGVFPLTYERSVGTRRRRPIAISFRRSSRAWPCRWNDCTLAK